MIDSIAIGVGMRSSFSYTRIFWDCNFLLPFIVTHKINECINKSENIYLTKFMKIVKYILFIMFTIQIIVIAYQIFLYIISSLSTFI